MSHQTTKDRILEYLLTNPVKDADYSKRFKTQFPDITEDLINAVLVELQEAELVWLTMGGGEIVFAEAAPKAHSYFQNKKEAEAAESRKKLDDRRWDIIKIGLGFLAGVLSTLFTLWLQGKLK